MASKRKARPLVIGYAGSLTYYRPGMERTRRWAGLRQWLWTYQVQNVNHHTRSGYFLFRGVERFVALYPSLAEHLEIHLWGLIHEVNKQQVEAFGIGEVVTIEGFLPKDQSHRKLMACDVLFLPLEVPHDGQDSLYLPGKMFEYMRFKKPVLILGARTDAVDILSRAGLGILCDPFDPDAVAAQLKHLVENRETLAARYQPDNEYIESNFSFRHLSKQLAHVFEAVLEET